MVAKSNFERFREKIRPNQNGCIDWVGAKMADGYGNFRVVYASGRERFVKAHRFALAMLDGLQELDRKELVLHSCDRPLCVNPAHLRFGTHKENVRDCLSRGRANTSKGEAHFCAKLNAKAVLEIRRSSKTARELALRYGVSTPTIYAVKHFRTWKEVR